MLLGKLLNEAISLHRTGRLADAESVCRQILKTDPSDFNARHLLGITHYQRGNYEEAIHEIDLALKANPKEASAHSNRGNALQALKRLDEALTSYDRAIALKPDYFDAFYNRGIALQGLKRLEEALASYDRAIALKPDYADAFNNLGNVLQELKRLDEALASFDRAIALKPNYAEVFSNRGTTLQGLKRLNEALASYDRAIALKPDYAEAFNNKAGVLQELGKLDEAIVCCEQALHLNPRFAEAHNSLGNALREQIKLDEAIASYERALHYKPDFAEAYNNLGVALKDQNKLKDAVAKFERALAFKANYAEAHSNLGATFQELTRFDDALAAYDRALMLKPDLAQACCGRGNVFTKIKQYNDALAAYDRALMLKPESDYALGAWLHAKMHCCLWDDIHNAYKKVLTEVAKGRKAALPFHLLSIPSSPSEQKIAAATYVADNFPPVAEESSSVCCPGKIRIGYFSADFRNHAVAYLIAHLFELHDRSKFEIFGFSFGRTVDDSMRRRLTTGFDQLIDVKDKSDKATAELAKNLGIGIAIDLMGITEQSRTGIFAHRAAPIQVNFLGFPGTMGASYIDYIVADRTLIRPGEAEFYSEKVVYLPHSYQVNDRTRWISDRAFRRDELGLPADAFVFCCFNNCFKITPDVFDIWMKLLAKVDGSVLWLLRSNESAVQSLCAEAVRHGIASDRLIFAEPMNLSDHLARHAAADLFLDTFYYNAHTTASDALWVGVPIVTRVGDTFAGRVAASLLNAVGLPELVTRTADEYEQLALELGTDRDKLLLIKKRLADNRLTCPLFDTELFRKHIESAYQTMWERYLMGLKPDHLCVEPS
jgi:predicted O-linked N-acetylglucosamine transferase (SPINDLY family)